MSQPVPQAIAFLVLRVTVGVYMVWFGFERASWLLDATPIASQLSIWLADAMPASRWLPGLFLSHHLLEEWRSYSAFGRVSRRWCRSRPCSAFNLAPV